MLCIEYSYVKMNNLQKKPKINCVFPFSTVTNVFHSRFMIAFKTNRNQQQSLSKLTDLYLRLCQAFALCFPWGLSIGTFLKLHKYEKGICTYINENACYNLPENSVTVLVDLIQSGREE